MEYSQDITRKTKKFQIIKKKSIFLIKYQNFQLMNECVLVSIWNAARYWGIHPVPEFGTRNYELICKSLGGLDDGCSYTDAHKELLRLGLKTRIGPWDIRWIRDNLPVQICIEMGREKVLHSVLIVEVKGQRVNVLNYDSNGHSKWLYWNQIKKMGLKSIEIPWPRSIYNPKNSRKPVSSIKETYKNYVDKNPRPFENQFL